MKCPTWKMKLILFILFISFYFLIFFNVTDQLHVKTVHAFRRWYYGNAGKPRKGFTPTLFNQSDAILFQNFTGKRIELQRLFELDQNSSSTDFQISQNYSEICGMKLSNRSSYCSEDLWQMDPNPAHNVVPNIVHFIFPFSRPEIDFHHTVCILSAYWMLKPRMMVLWYAQDQPPRGHNWNYLVRNLTQEGEFVVLMPIVPPAFVYGQPMNAPEHKSDILRLEILYLFGGVYLDLDVVVLKSFEPLYQYAFTIGREVSYGLCNGIMLSSRGNLLLRRWHLFYRWHYSVNTWGGMSVVLPQVIYEQAPSYFHVEEDSMNRPNWTRDELPWIYGSKREWKWQGRNYAVHLWFRFSNKHSLNFNNIDWEDSMLGDMFRFILYGNSSVRNVERNSQLIQMFNSTASNRTM